MAIIGVQIDKTNPTYTVNDFLFWMPQFSNYMGTPDGSTRFNKLYEIANKRIFKSIFGTDWELAMSYCIAHYFTLIAQQVEAPSGSTLGSIAGGGVTRGVLSQAQIGNFSKSYELSATMLSDDNSKFWNQTSYGMSLMALYKTKAVPSIFVVTSNPITGAN